MAAAIGGRSRWSGGGGGDGRRTLQEGAQTPKGGKELSRESRGGGEHARGERASGETAAACTSMESLLHGHAERGGARANGASARRERRGAERLELFSQYGSGACAKRGGVSECEQRGGQRGGSSRTQLVQGRADFR